MTDSSEIIAENDRLRAALQAAEVGTWDYHLRTGQMQWSPICKQLFGLPTDLHVTTAILLDQVHPDDRQRVGEANARVFSPSSDGQHDVTFRTLNPQHTLRWVRAQGKIIRDTQGQPVRFSGIVQDVTLSVVAQQKLAQSEERYRQLSRELESQVQRRTQELEASVQDLKRSNHNLEQFAYIASHDLQEPLRKIQSFSTLLQNNYTNQLGEGIDYLRRMQNASTRMSVLIKDLLLYSRISTQQQISTSVPLMSVVDSVLVDLDLVVHETGAVIHVDSLPTVLGNGSQLRQLFQNLLSNGIKFRYAGASPQISISSRQIEAENLPAMVKPTRWAPTYHQIDVSDNGIGFDDKYVDRIFQVFQRLHGKDTYGGTGIGLAICEKVVSNHGGAITARSQPGQGATFSVYLPV